MNLPDLRPQLTSAQDWVADLVAGVRRDQLEQPTPCTEYTVAQLIEHLFGVAQRTLAYATDRAVGDTPAMVPLTSVDPARLAAELREVNRCGAEAWANWSPSQLGEPITAPFGTVPAAAGIGIMASENLVHGWDLAVATGQPCETDPALAETLLPVMQRALPAQRGAEIPFADAVEPIADAGPTERLANLTGRSR
ncbi:TIGR03086 family metal-binding protein [Enemella dayhoffiae]|nr:TIGR03086 family metal-binding protein [Enemella dayhoffiae]